MKKEKKGLAIILSAPSGAGKTTVCFSLKKKFPDLKFSVSYTTRLPRNNERYGVDYHFISNEAFQKMIEDGEFLEWTEILGYHYGTSLKKLEEMRKKGTDIILELDVHGVETLRSLGFSGIYIFILPPSMEELKKRLTQRATESADIIKERLELGRKEIAKIQSYDYVVTNHEVEDTVDTIMSILKTEKHKREYYHSKCPEIQEIMNLG